MPAQPHLVLLSSVGGAFFRIPTDDAMRRSEPADDALQDVERDGDVLLGDRLARVVADAALAADEQHRDGADRARGRPRRAPPR